MSTSRSLGLRACWSSAPGVSGNRAQTLARRGRRAWSTTEVDRPLRRGDPQRSGGKRGRAIGRHLQGRAGLVEQPVAAQRRLLAPRARARRTDARSAPGRRSRPRTPGTLRRHRLDLAAHRGGQALEELDLGQPDANAACTRSGGLRSVAGGQRVGAALRPVPQATGGFGLRHSPSPAARQALPRSCAAWSVSVRICSRQTSSSPRKRQICTTGSLAP